MVLEKWLGVFLLLGELRTEEEIAHSMNGYMRHTVTENKWRTLIGIVKAGITLRFE